MTSSSWICWNLHRFPSSPNIVSESPECSRFLYEPYIRVPRIQPSSFQICSVINTIFTVTDDFFLEKEQFCGLDAHIVFTQCTNSHKIRMIRPKSVQKIAVDVSIAVNQNRIRSSFWGDRQVTNELLFRQSVWVGRFSFFRSEKPGLRHLRAPVIIFS